MKVKVSDDGKEERAKVGGLRSTMASPFVGSRVEHGEADVRRIATPCRLQNGPYVERDNRRKSLDRCFARKD